MAYSTPEITRLNSQPYTISGKVTSSEGEPLPGVNILEKGTTNGAVTDLNGNFTLILKETNTSIMVSYIGFLTQEIDIIPDKEFYSIVMVEDLLQIEEMVVVGYGYQRKSDLTGSVASIGEEQIQSISVANAAEALKGRIAGVSISQNDAAPGAGLSIKIRGNNSINSSNSPLIVVDGFTQAGNLNAINPRDIKSIEVLKDASATAIYGARGANGVILITTNSGENNKLKVNLNIAYGTKTLRNSIELLNAPQYMELFNEARGDIYTEQEIANAQTTDWQDLIYRSGSRQNYQFSISDGNERSTYNLSINYLEDQGNIINSYFERFSVRARTVTRISDKIKFDNTLYASRNKSNSTPRNTNGYGFNPSVPDLALKFTPNLPLKDEDGKYNNLDDLPNPYAVASERLDQLTEKYIYDYAQLEYDPLKSLNIKSTFGVKLAEDLSQDYWPSTITTIADGKGRANTGNSSLLSWSNENIITYKKAIHNHNVHLTGAFTQEHSENFFEGVDAQHFLSDLLSYYGVGGSQNIEKTVVYSGGQEENYMSLLGRVFYNYNNKYYLTFSVRRDGSSKFSKNEKWGNFPSLALAYRLSEESFMKNQTLINNLKLRASYGLTGNTSGLGNYRDRFLFNLASQTVAIFNETAQRMLTLTNLENKNLRWETTAQTDIGIDIGFLEDRINVVADYYYKKTTDLLFFVQLPEGLEVGRQWQNIGSLENKGFEFNLNTLNISNKNFKWSTTLNFSLNRNKVLELSEADQFFDGYYSGLVSANTPLTVVKVGEPLGSFYGYYSLGVFPDNSSVNEERISYSYLPNPLSPEGFMKFKDINGDGKVNNNDVTIIGNAQPDFIFGITNQIDFFDFDFSFFIEGVVGADVYNVNRFILDNTNANTNASTRVLNRWTPDNRITDVPGAGATISEGHSGFIEDGTFYRLRDVQLGYNLPLKLVNKLKIGSARAYVSAQNYFTITDYLGYDPEVNSKGSNSILQNIDYGSYPAFKSISFGINVDF